MQRAGMRWADRGTHRESDASPRFGRRAGGDEGAALVEFALVGPIVLVLIFGIIEFGFAFSAQLELRSASREGGRLAAVDNGCAGSTTCGTDQAQLDALIAATRSRANGLAQRSNLKISISCTSSSNLCKDAKIGDSVTVCLNYMLRSQTGFFAPILDTKLMSSKAVFRVEQPPTFREGTDSGGPGPATCA
jgi:hypothetical protein